MKKKLSVLLITCLLIAAAVLSGCNNPKNMLAKAYKSVGGAQSVNYSLTVSDNGVTVYSYEKTVTVNGDDAAVTVDEATLGESFTLEHVVTTSTAPKGEQLVLPLAVTEDKLSTAEVNGNLLTCVISKDNFAAMLDSDSLVSSGDVTVMFVITDGKCKQMVCNYVTETSKTVNMTVVCEY